MANGLCTLSPAAQKHRSQEPNDWRIQIRNGGKFSEGPPVTPLPTFVQCPTKPTLSSYSLTLGAEDISMKLKKQNQK